MPAVFLLSELSEISLVLSTKMITVHAMKLVSSESRGSLPFQASEIMEQTIPFFFGKLQDLFKAIDRDVAHREQQFPDCSRRLKSQGSQV